MKVQGQAYETWRWDRDCETGAKSALGLNLTTTVEGPAPTCDGCFATLRLEAEDGTYATAFQHWTGDPRVTAYNQQRPAFAEKRSVFHSAVLPNVGRYDLEVEMHSIDYRGMLARGEGGHITTAKESTVQLTTSWVNVRPHLAFRCTSGEAALGIQNKKQADPLCAPLPFGSVCWFPPDDCLVLTRLRPAQVSKPSLALHGLSIARKPSVHDSCLDSVLT